MTRQYLVVLIAALLAVLMTLPAQAGWVSSLGYFETQVPSACMAGNPQNVGTYVRQYKDSYQCSGLPVYHIVHGAGVHPWSTESFYVKDGFLWQMMEIFINSSTGEFTSYRAFREQVNFWGSPP